MRGYLGHQHVDLFARRKPLDLPGADGGRLAGELADIAAIAERRWVVRRMPSGTNLHRDTVAALELQSGRPSVLGRPGRNGGRRPLVAHWPVAASPPSRPTLSQLFVGKFVRLACKAVPQFNLPANSAHAPNFAGRRLFVRWQSRLNREAHVRFCEWLGVEFPEQPARLPI